MQRACGGVERSCACHTPEVDCHASALMKTANIHIAGATTGHRLGAASCQHVICCSSRHRHALRLQCSTLVTRTGNGGADLGR